MSDYFADSRTEYDAEDLAILRNCGRDSGGPVAWQLDDYLSMAHCDYILRFKRGGEARTRMRLLIRKAQAAYRRELGDLSTCPFDDEYRRRPIQDMAPSYETDIRTPPPANVKDLIVDYLERNGRRKRQEIVEAMVERRYAQDTVDDALGTLVVENRIHRESWGSYALGPKESKKQKSKEIENAELSEGAAE